MSSRRDKRKVTTDDIIRFALGRHWQKCQAGIDCNLCKHFLTGRKTRSMPVSKLNLVFASEHYRKCREKEFSSTAACVCGEIRGMLKTFNEKFRLGKPLSLEFLSVCAVSPGSNLMDHPFKDEVILFREAAIKVQKRWRAYLQARGPYRVTRCRFYQERGGCRNGVNCSYAHGWHDVRPKFVKVGRKKNGIKPPIIQKKTEEDRLISLIGTISPEEDSEEESRIDGIYEELLPRKKKRKKIT